jgi:stage IV sporulation protein FB
MIEGALVSLPVVSRHGIFFWLLRSLVKVRWTFFLTAVLLGLRTRSVSGVAVWLGVVFVAVLLHEYGHAFAARHYGQNPQIELHAMGGVTKWAWVDELKWWNRLLISLAGPFAGFLLGALVWAAGRLWPGYLYASYLLHVAQYQFLWASLAWGAFNLLPLLPMDGGAAMAEYLEHRRGRAEGRLLAHRISFATGLGGLAGGLLFDEAWAGLVCGIFAFDNYQRMHGQPGVRFPG